MLDLLQAQSQLCGARSKLIESKKNVFLPVAELAHSTGTLGISAEKAQAVNQ